jgi:hypothetical protein
MMENILIFKEIFRKISENEVMQACINIKQNGFKTLGYNDKDYGVKVYFAKSNDFLIMRRTFVICKGILPEKKCASNNIS